MRITEGVDGISGIHNLRTRRIGNYLAIEMHVRLDGSMTLAEAHDRSSLVERRLKERYGAETYVSVPRRAAQEHAARQTAGIAARDRTTERGRRKRRQGRR